MRKKDELSRENTCMRLAHPDEMTFVLLGRDAAAPAAIRAWIAERVRLGKNAESDAQIVEAIAYAQTMEDEGRTFVTKDRSGPATGVEGLDFHRWRGVDYQVEMVLNGAKTPEDQLNALRHLSRIMRKKMKHGGGMLQPFETAIFALFESLGMTGES